MLTTMCFQFSTYVEYLSSLFYGCDLKGGAMMWRLFGFWPGKDIVFRFIIEYSSLRDFGP
jgi:hypothetical protein